MYREVMKYHKKRPDAPDYTDDEIKVGKVTK